MPDSLTQIVPDAAARHGDRTAIVIDGRSFTFTELDQLTGRFASGLARLGVGPGDVVTLYSENRWEWIVTYYGVLRLGAVINPINVMLTPGEVEFVVRDCRAKAIVASGEKGTPIVGVQGSSEVAEMILFDDDAVVDGTRSFASVLDSADGLHEPAGAQPGDLSTICYTSGTTGHPKGAMQSHEAVLLNAAMTAQMHGRTAADVALNALPLPHVYGTVIMNATMLLGHQLVIHPRFDPDAVLAALEQHRVTVFDGVPTMYMYLLDHPELDQRDLTALTRCYVGGQPMPISKMREVEERFACPLFELWGMTELAGLGTTHPLYGRNRLGSIGIEMPYTDIRIADVDDASVTLPPGQVGELMVRGPFVMLGYFGNDEATAETIEPDGWMHTGDLASIDADGFVFIVDRKKDMILTGGFNVYPAELERVVAAHPSVALVAVGPRPDAVKGELAKAYVVLKDGAEPDADGILTHCREHLAAYKVPRELQFVSELPTTSTGKIMRRQLHTLDPQPSTV